MPISLQSADRFLSFAISFLTLQISKKTFMADPRTIFYLRAAFAASAVLQLAFAFIIKRRILQKNDQTTFKMQPEASLFSDPNEAAETLEIKKVEYDTSEINKLIQSTLLHAVVIALVHYKWNILQPLMIQSTTFVRSLCFNPMFYEYIYGVEMIRPFSENMLFSSSKKDLTGEEAAAAKKKKED